MAFTWTVSVAGIAATLSAERASKLVAELRALHECEQRMVPPLLVRPHPCRLYECNGLPLEATLVTLPRS